MSLSEYRSTGFARVALLLAAVMLFGAGPVRAQGQFEGNYTLSMAGIPIGKLQWQTKLTGNDYTIAANGRTSGILSVLLSGEGNVSLKGVLRDVRSQSAT